MKKFELSTTGTAMRSGFIAPTRLRSTGGVRLQPVGRRVLGAMTDANGGATPGLPTSSPPIT